MMTLPVKGVSEKILKRVSVCMVMNKGAVCFVATLL